MITEFFWEEKLVYVGGGGLYDDPTASEGPELTNVNLNKNSILLNSRIELKMCMYLY